MPFNGSGTFSLVAGNPVVTGTVISSTVQNNTTSDFATAFTNCVTRDGQSAALANLPMGGFKHTGAAVATAANQYLTYGQALNGTTGTFSGAVSCTDLTTTGNNILGNAQADTLNVGNGDIIKDASGNTGFGVTPTAKLDMYGSFLQLRDGTYLAIIGKGSTTVSGGGSSDLGISVGGSGDFVFGLGGTLRFNMKTDGRFYGTALHNNANALTGATNQYVGSGTYTPTLTNVTNATSISATICQYMRVGNVVSVSGKIDCAATSSATLSVVRISLPIASALTASTQCRGSGAHIAATSILAASVDGDATNDAALIRFIPPATGSVETSFIFQYEVL